MVASGIALAVAGVKDQTLGNMYHKPTRVILGAELVVKDNAKDYYFPEAAF